MSTVQSIIALQDKFTPTLSKIERQAIQQIQTFEKMSREVDNYKKSLEAVEKSNPKIVESEMYLKASDALHKMEDSLYNVAAGEKNLKLNTEGTTRSLDDQIKRLLRWAAIMAGVKKLMNLSDTYTQTHARLGMITEDVDRLENKIYQVAQNSRVAYQSVADTVSKLGMQAGEAFNNNADEVVAFSELLNKTFTFSGMDTNAIDSVMYNLTQSLSSGKLLGQDYRILKQNAPQMIKYLEQFYGVNRAGLDEMVSKGQVTAKGLKAAIFNATDDINDRFKKMPVTFEQVWTKFKNTLLKVLQPVLKILSTLADWLDKLVTFLDEHKYILYVIAAAIAALTIEYIALNAAAIGAQIAQWALNSAMYACPVTWIIILIAGLIAVLLYLWETNDKVAEALIFAWDAVQVGLGVAVSGIKGMWLMLASIVGEVCSYILKAVQWVVNALQGAYNLRVKAINALGGDAQEIEYSSFGDDFKAGLDEYTLGLGEDLESYWNTNVWDKAGELNRTRSQRVQDRFKFGSLTEGLENLLNGGDFGESLEDVMGTDSTGGKAIKTTTNDDLLSDEDIQLLLDVATRDYKLNYQQITPNITLTFGDVRETADVDDIIDKVADRLEEIYEGNLEVSPA